MSQGGYRCKSCVMSFCKQIVPRKNLSRAVCCLQLLMKNIVVKASILNIVGSCWPHVSLQNKTPPQVFTQMGLTKWSDMCYLIFAVYFLFFANLYHLRNLHCLHFLSWKKTFIYPGYYQLGKQIDELRQWMEKPSCCKLSISDWSSVHTVQT